MLAAWQMQLGRCNFFQVFSHHREIALVLFFFGDSRNQMAGWLMLYDMSVDQTNLSPSLLFLLETVGSSPTAPHAHAVFFVSPSHMTWDFFLPLRTCCLHCRPGKTSQETCSSALQYPSSLQKSFMHSKAVIMLLLDFCSCLKARKVHLIFP